MRARGPLGTVAALLAVLTVLGCSGCGGDGTASPSAGTGSGTPSVSGSVTVMAPAPLKGVLDKATAAFRSAHPGLAVSVNYGHVPALLTQLSQGVPGDVLVTPDEATMQLARTKGVTTSTALPLARNDLVLVVPAANPARVKDVSSLGDPKLTIAVCAAELPCGQLTGQLATRAGVTVSADSLEPGGSPGVVTKAAAGEIDLGACYAVDVTAGGDRVTAIPLAGELGAYTTVMATPLKSAGNPDAAAAFVTFLSSAEGRTLFTHAGFSPR